MQKAQLRAARALLGWSQSDLAEASGVSLPTVKRIEPGDGPIPANLETASKLRMALEGAGIMFVEPGATSVPAGAGVRLRDIPAGVVPQLSEMLILHKALLSKQEELAVLLETGAHGSDQARRLAKSIRMLLTHIEEGKPIPVAQAG